MFGDALHEGPDDPGVDVEEVVAGHSGLAGDACGDDHELRVERRGREGRGEGGRGGGAWEESTSVLDFRLRSGASALHIISLAASLTSTPLRQSPSSASPQKPVTCRRLS